jgi:hypothetical protein
MHLLCIWLLDFDCVIDVDEALAHSGAHCSMLHHVKGFVWFVHNTATNSLFSPPLRKGFVDDEKIVMN